jgi:amidohydrolase
MVKAGAMEDVDGVLALHVHGGTVVGDVTLSAGPTSAGVDSFWATISGQGAHGAYPHKGLDPIHIAGHVILALHGIVSRRVNPFDPAVITVGSIHGGQANNVIPKQVKVRGTIRYQDPEVQKLLHAEIEQALDVARSLGGDYALKIRMGSPPVVNDPRLVDLVREVVTDLVGAEHLKPREEGMGAEDFAVLAAQAPGVMFRLGCMIEGDERKGHSPSFDLDERCLPIGVAILAEAVLRLLRQKGEKI